MDDDGLIDESEVLDPEVPFEDVDCPPLKGKVRVRALDALEGMHMVMRIGALTEANPDAGYEATLPVMFEMLALCVVGKKGSPVYSVQRWKNFGIKNKTLVQELFNTAWRLSGLPGAEQKKS